MNKSSKQTGFAIALAWPQTYCKQPGAWYDGLTFWLGVNQNNYYKVGHAALVLIDVDNQKAHYFDFGSYHSPYQHGRVRSAETDHDLEMKTKPVLSSDKLSIINYHQILHELQTNPACHGEGELVASYCTVNFEQSFEKVRQMQAPSPIPYGPFNRKGSNCSRFVHSAILAGQPQWHYLFNLKYLVPFTPTPISNVNSLTHRVVLPKLLKGEPFCPIKKLDKHLLLSTLPQPIKHPDIPAHAQWLGGEGAGSWFAFTLEDTLLKVTRFSPQGVVECTGLYENKNASLVLKNINSYTIAYPSNCKMGSIRVNNSEIRFHRAV